jgi:hypothetical protein
VSRDGSLPPGVTGNEYAIAGPDREFDEERMCGAKDVTIKTIDGYGQRQIERVVGMLAEPGPNLIIATHYLRAGLGQIEEVTLEECTFVGDVTLQWSEGYEMWECPMCHTSHEKEIDDE